VFRDYFSLLLNAVLNPQNHQIKSFIPVHSQISERVKVFLAETYRDTSAIIRISPPLAQ